MKRKLAIGLLVTLLGISTVACGKVAAPANDAAVETSEAVDEVAADAETEKEEDKEAEVEAEKEDEKQDEEAVAESKDDAEEVPHVEENIDIAETELSKDSMISGWDVTKQPENVVDNRTNVSLSNMKKIGLKALPDDAMGMVYLAPNTTGTGRDMLFGTRELVMYFQRQGVNAGEGTISVFNSRDDSPICSVNAKKSVKSYDDSDGTFELLGWEKGTRVVISLPFPLDHNETFYITADEGCFVADTDNGTVKSKAIKKNAWELDVAEYGVIPQLPSGSDVYVGGSMDIAFYIQGRCKKAEITSFDENRVRFSKTEIREDKVIEAKFYQLGQDECMVTFYDNDDNILGQTKLIYIAEMDPNTDLKADSNDNKEKDNEKSDDSNNTLNL